MKTLLIFLGCLGLSLQASADLSERNVVCAKRDRLEGYLLKGMPNVRNFIGAAAVTTFQDGQPREILRKDLSLTQTNGMAMGATSIISYRILDVDSQEKFLTFEYKRGQRLPSKATLLDGSVSRPLDCDFVKSND